MAATCMHCDGTQTEGFVTDGRDGWAAFRLRGSVVGSLRSGSSDFEADGEAEAGAQRMGKAHSHHRRRRHKHRSKHGGGHKHGKRRRPHPTYHYMIQKVLSSNKHRVSGCSADSIAQLCMKMYGKKRGPPPLHMAKHVHKQVRQLFRKGKLAQKGHRYVLAANVKIHRRRSGRHKGHRKGRGRHRRRRRRGRKRGRKHGRKGHKRKRRRRRRRRKHH